MFAHCQNTYPDLLSLQGDLNADTQRFSLQICPGTIAFDLATGRVRLGLTGFQLAVSGEDLGTFDGQNLIQNLIQQLSEQCSESHWQILSAQALSGFSLGSDGLRRSLNLEGCYSLDYSTTFRLSLTAADMRILDSEGIWHHDIHPNTQGILERVLVQHLHQSRLTGWLSYGILGQETDPDPLDPTAEDLDSMESSPFNDHQFNDHQLSALVQSLIHSSGDLPTLLNLAQLDPLHDLKGGQFMAADFRNVDLSGADLGRSNLRGSDLSDGDFTEANLSYARLSGANLSGALLSNVNFRGANLHRASLALANLSGADLRDADLSGANLCNVNLGGTQVQGLKWGNNEGITPELEDYLRSSGALFSA